MKSLNEMGDGMRKRLTALASDFSRRMNNGYAQAPQAERKPLIGQHGEEDEDDDEVISFQDEQPSSSGAKKKNS